MASDEADHIAQQAAQLYMQGQAETVGEAIRQSVEMNGWLGHAPPATGRVRQHIQAMTMQELGVAGYQQLVARAMSAAEELMTALETALPDATTLLVGRGAKGYVDGDGAMYMRLYTKESVEAIADSLIDIGYDEPGLTTVNTRLGRLNRLTVADDEADIVVTRCLPDMRSSAGLDFFHGRPLQTMDLGQLRQFLQGLQSDLANEGNLI